MAILRCPVTTALDIKVIEKIDAEVERRRRCGDSNTSRADVIRALLAKGSADFPDEDAPDEDSEGAPEKADKKIQRAG